MQWILELRQSKKESRNSNVTIRKSKISGRKRLIKRTIAKEYPLSKAEWFTRKIIRLRPTQGWPIPKQASIKCNHQFIS